MTAEEVSNVLGVSKGYAYNIMKKYNKELENKGFIVIPGKIPTKFLAEKIYGMTVEEE
jgi:sugar-specific transcriptional regulator TrmB